MANAPPIAPFLEITRRDMAIAAMPRVVDVEFLEEFHRAMDEAERAAVTKMESVLFECHQASLEAITTCIEEALYYFNTFQTPCGAVSAVKKVLQANEITNGNGQRLHPHTFAECVLKVRDAANFRLQWVSHPIGDDGSSWKENLSCYWGEAIPDDQKSFWLQSYRKVIYDAFLTNLLGPVENINRGGPRAIRQRRTPETLHRLA